MNHLGDEADPDQLVVNKDLVGNTENNYFAEM